MTGDALSLNAAFVCSFHSVLAKVDCQGQLIPDTVDWNPSYKTLLCDETGN